MACPIAQAAEFSMPSAHMASITGSSVGKFCAVAGVAIARTAARPRNRLLHVLIFVSTRVAVVGVRPAARPTWPSTGEKILAE